jgi:transcriptional regulator with GAF, ATPase, and Fis domain
LQDGVVWQFGRSPLRYDGVSNTRISALFSPQPFPVLSGPESPVPAYLLMNAGLRAGSRYRLEESGQNHLGRDWDCRVVLNDPQCSRVHASIYMQEGAWWIRDNASSNGTYVNGQRIDEAQLAEGHQVQLGSSRFTFCTSHGSDAAADASDEQATHQTLILDERFNSSETGQYTLEFLSEQRSGGDFFFLFQLSVKLLSVDKPDEVVSLCVSRLLERTEASVAGFMWLTDRGQLQPRVVFPVDESGKLTLDDKLTKRVVEHKHLIRVEHGTGESDTGFADSLCLPLIKDEEVVGALHLYRQNSSFNDDQVKLASSVANIMIRSLQRANRQATIEADRQRLAFASADSNELIGQSEPMQTLKSKIRRVARASGCVLIRGESGSGKELVSRALHRSSNRADRPMLSVNCAAIPRDLMESQLFGHKKGAFTSADSDHIGWFQQADLGTLFLDEVGELTLEGQAKLLRILEGHPFLPVGGSQELTVDVRVICATNRDLHEFVKEKKFREDLYYRLSVFELVIPPLRDRGGDLRLLIDHFLQHFRQQHGRPNLQLSDEALARMLSFQWPGNVRQLRNVIDSAVVMAETDEISIDDLGIRENLAGDLESLKIDYWERKLIKEALVRSGNNVPRAADLLGISRATLYRKIDEYAIERK